MLTVAVAGGVFLTSDTVTLIPLLSQGRTLVITGPTSMIWADLLILRSAD